MKVTRYRKAIINADKVIQTIREYCNIQLPETESKKKKGKK